MAELDDLLEEGTLREVKVQFWRRYKVKYPVEVSPSDQLLSRCYREMETRLLTVYDVWKVKNLLHQVMTTKKRKQVGTDLYTFEEEPEATPKTRGVEEYLAMLHTYLLALAIAGSNKVQGAPVEEAFGSDSAKFVEVPWEVLQSYYFRASHSVMLVPEASRLAWLEGRDIAERAAWVSQSAKGMNHSGKLCNPSWRRGELIGMHPFRAWWCAQAQPFLPSSQRCRNLRGRSRVSNKINGSQHRRRGRNR